MSIYCPRCGEPENPALQQPSESLKPVSVDRVAEWLAAQDRVMGAPRLSVGLDSASDPASVEEMFDMLDPISPVKTASMTAQKEADDFCAFFGEEDLQLPIAVAVYVPPSDLEASSDSALSTVEELYEAFKRLEQQLGTITDSLQTYNPHP